MMLYAGTYDWTWLLAAVVFLVPLVFTCICRRSLERFSRKWLLERAPADEKQRYEELLLHRDECIEALCLPAFVFSLGSGIALTLARYLAIEEQLGDGRRLIDAGTSFILLHGSTLALELIGWAGLFLYLVPAIVARAGAEGVLLRVLPLLDAWRRWTAPLNRMGEGASRLGALAVGMNKERSSADIAEEEIRSAVEEGQREGLLKTKDIDMIESIMSYGHVEVSEVMTPRTDMVALDVDDPPDAILEQVIACGHTRIPVYRGNKDRVIGILYVKDLQKYLHRRESIQLEAIVRPPVFVKERQKIGDLLHKFLAHRHHIAVVQDDHGGTAGLVTIEDILEEIVGEISDEYESDDRSVQSVGANAVEVDASIHIDDLNEQLGLSIPEGETYDTLGGYVFETLGRVPAVGDDLTADGLRFEVLEADERRVHRVRIHTPPSEPAEGAGGQSPATAPGEVA